MLICSYPHFLVHRLFVEKPLLANPYYLHIYIAFSSYKKVPSGDATVIKIHNLYEKRKAEVEEVLVQTNKAAPTGDYWTSVHNHSYPGVTAHYCDCSHALDEKREE